MFLKRKFFQLLDSAQGGDSGGASGGSAPAAPPAGDLSSGGDFDIVRRLSQLVGGDDGGASDGGEAGDDAGADDDRADGQGLALHPEDSKSEQREDTKPAADKQDAADPVLTVKVNGEEKAVKQSELIAHYQKGDASAKRFEEAAQIRRAAEQVQAQAAQERQHLQQALQVYSEQLQALQAAQQPDWKHLLDNDPAEFQRQRFHFEQRQAQMQQAQAAQAHLMQQQQALQEQQRQEAMAQEAQKLLEKLPDWQDAEKAKAGRAALRESLQAFGFNDAEIGGLSDHRMVLVAHKAMLYDQLMAQQAKAREQVPAKLEKLPPPRMERPGGGEGISPTDGRTKAMQRLNKSGSPRDAAAVIAHLL